MRRILFTETNFGALPNPPAGFKYIGFDGPNFSGKDETGTTFPTGGATGPQGPIGATGPQGTIGATGPGFIYKTYTALLTETLTQGGTDMFYFNNALIVGETYTITDYVSGDDFSNIANVITGTINETGCVFVATGTQPNVWTNLSEIFSDGGLIVNELENTLGFDVVWVTPPNSGQYIAFDPSEVASFPGEKTTVSVGIKTSQWGEQFVIPFTEIATISYAEDSILFHNIDMSGAAPFLSYPGALKYTPVTINIYP